MILLCVKLDGEVGGTRDMYLVLYERTSVPLLLALLDNGGHVDLFHELARCGCYGDQAGAVTVVDHSLHHLEGRQRILQYKII